MLVWFNYPIRNLWSPHASFLQSILLLQRRYATKPNRESLLFGIHISSRTSIVSVKWHLVCFFSLGTFIFYKAFFRAVTTNHQSGRDTVLTDVLNGGNFPPISPLVHRRKNKGVMSQPRVNEHPQTPSVYRYTHTQTDISASLVCRHGWEMTTIGLSICKFSSISLFLLTAFNSRCSHVKMDRLTS